MEQALGPEIPLPSGGTLWLEATRACWTADVDSGSAHGAAAEIRRQANREAAVELARQIRLRQAAGAFVADFLRMDGRAEQTAVIQHLQAAFAEDPARLHFNPGFDSVGLYAFSRGRIAAPLASRLDDGGLCQAVLAGLRSLVRNSLAEPHRRLALHLAPAAAVAAQGLPTALEDCKRQLGLAPSIVSDAALARTDFVVRPAERAPNGKREWQCLNGPTPNGPTLNCRTTWFRFARVAGLPPARICSKPAQDDYRPFCSKRCADIDLHKWLGEGYRVETDEPADDMDGPPEPTDR